jgi:7-carboxy-7-deazaguanine synthase
MPCIFIRLTGCDLRCTYCDTDYAFDEGKTMSISEILNQIKTYPARLVEITGGEPLLQPEVYPLMTLLCDEGYEVMLETGGHILADRVDERVHKIFDIKTPDSGMASRNELGNLHLALAEANNQKLNSEFKFVLCSWNDYKWAKAFVEAHALVGRLGLFFSPAYPKLNITQLAEWLLEDGLQVKLQIQLHKVIWPGLQRGV